VVSKGGDVGAYTALLPYTRERYLENHKVMAALDKLHKLYSSTSEPVVWARSVGLEVLNELDSIKAAIMMTAGAKSQVHSDPGWATLVGAAKNITAGVGTIQMAGETLSKTFGGAIQALRKSMDSQQDFRK